MSTTTLAAPTTFDDLGVAPPLLKALAKMEIVTPSEIQVALIPPALEGRDVVGQARTGTGKTLAFALPTLQQLTPGGGVQALCVVPTRELALQVTEEVRDAARYAKLRVTAVYGGQRIKQQLTSLEKDPEFVVCTPGRLLDFLERGAISTRQVATVILDEVDRMLDIGFRDDIRRIFRQIKQAHQTIVVSATIEGDVEKLIRQQTKDPVWLNVSRDQVSVSDIEEYYVTAEANEKFPALLKLLDHEHPELAIIFTNTKGKARRLAQSLADAGRQVAELHGDLHQRKREKVMKRFRDADIHLLVATDVAARGIDVEGITHIINYDVPLDPEVHIHRVGRTGRMGAQGKAVTFATRADGKYLTAIEMLANKMIDCRTIPGFVSRPEAARRF